MVSFVHVQLCLVALSLSYAGATRDMSNGEMALSVSAKARYKHEAGAASSSKEVPEMWQPLQEASKQLEEHMELLVEQRTKLEQQIDTDEKQLALYNNRLTENRQTNQTIVKQIDRLTEGRRSAQNLMAKTMEDSAAVANAASTGSNEHEAESPAPQGEPSESPSPPPEATPEKETPEHEESHEHESGEHNDAVNFSPEENEHGPAGSFLQTDSAAAGLPKMWEPLGGGSNQLEQQLDLMIDQKLQVEKQIVADEREVEKLEDRVKENKATLKTVEAQVNALKEGRQEAKKALENALKKSAEITDEKEKGSESEEESPKESTGGENPPLPVESREDHEEHTPEVTPEKEHNSEAEHNEEHSEHNDVEGGN